MRTEVIKKALQQLGNLETPEGLDESTFSPELRAALAGARAALAEAKQALGIDDE